MACPAKSYRSFPSASSLAHCATCPSGYYCPTNATATPTPCPQGGYCGRGVDVWTDCPPGTFGNTTRLKLVTDCTSCTPVRPTPNSFLFRFVCLWCCCAVLLCFAARSCDFLTCGVVVWCGVVCCAACVRVTTVTSLV